VRFTLGPLGVVSEENPFKFDPDVTVGKGDEGVYLAPQDPGEDGRLEGWHTCAIEHEGRQRLVPVHEEQFEEAR
jgi:hypothetical protein